MFYKTDILVSKIDVMVSKTGISLSQVQWLLKPAGEEVRRGKCQSCFLWVKQSFLYLVSTSRDPLSNIVK